MRGRPRTGTGTATLAAAVCCALGLAAPAFAGVTTLTTKIDGAATGSGSFGRTIIDAVPNQASRRIGTFGVQGGTVLIPVTTGMTANQIAAALRDSINSNPMLQAGGYAARFCDSSQVKLTRAAGQFNWVDNVNVPGVSVSYSSGDTVWVGHVFDPTYTAGGTMPAGGYGPYRLGRGPARPTGSPVGDNGLWDFDRFQAGENDSLHGWLPLARPYQGEATTLPDYRRAFEGLDYGNQANYAINQGAPKRTFGVTGLWHRDRGNAAYAPGDTIAGTHVQSVKWAATEVGGAGSTASAWCGIRSHGDLSVLDATALGGTGNPFNASLMQYQGNNGFHAAGSVSLNGTDHNFPGYGSQMDQMLYRDVQLAEGDGLNLSFNFSTNLSTSKNATAGVQIGWFDKDPISNAQVGVGTGATPSSDGNFISATVAGAGAPCDSFMVYIGAPVNDNEVMFSAPLFVEANEITTVYDKKRRWLSEVLQLSGNCPSCAIIGKEIASYAGIHTPTSVSCNFGALYPVALQEIKDADGQAGNGGKVRIVFRVKTNRGFDDENGGNPSAAYDSGTRGAAIIDNVVVNGWAAANGNFESVSAINNDIAVNPLAAWKSTGKPTAPFLHLHDLNSLPFTNPATGNLAGQVISIGDHDASEKATGDYGSNLGERMSGVVSPTIHLTSSGPGAFNGIGIDAAIANASDDIYLRYEVYTGVLDTASTGVGWVIGVQSYPARSPNGNRTWGEFRYSPLFSSSTVRSLIDVQGLGCLGLIRTSNPSGIPDSIRIYLGDITRCYAYGLSAPACAPTIGPQTGGYFDNVALGFVDMLTVQVNTPGPEPPVAASLISPSPNPFTTTSLIAFELPREGPVQLVIHDLMGRRVRTLLDGVRPAGRWSASWDGRDDALRAAPSGVYLVRMRYGGEIQQRTLVKVR
jgi:hypothetical protein